MNPEQFLELGIGHRLRKRNGDGAIFIICQKYGHAVLLACSEIIVDPHEWEYENGRQVERFSDMREGVKVRRKHSAADFFIVTKIIIEPGREHAHIARTESVSLPEAGEWMQVLSFQSRPQTIADLVGETMRFVSHR